MHQTAQSFHPEPDIADIDALLERVCASTKEAIDALDDALAFITESNKRIETISRARR
jgi:hypothetical protein